MTRSRLVDTLRNPAAALVAACTMLAGCGGTDEPTPPAPTGGFNVVLIVSDALRRDSPGCYGGGARTPNIDRLAARGVLFENAYSTSPWTPPSAVSIFTANYATSYPHAEYRKTIKIEVPDAEVLPAEVLRERGYVTAIKNENVQTSLHNCFQGFEPLMDEQFYDRLGTEVKRSIRRITGGTFRGNLQYLHNYQLLLFLQEVPDDKNFFAAQWMLDPHEPYMPVEEFKNRIEVDASRLTRPPAMYVARKNIEGEPNEAEIRYLEARYLAEVESVDERVGYVLSVLEREGRLDSTYFVFTSDHGEMFGEHGRFGHGRDYYEELMRVPLIIAGPGLPAGTRVAAHVSLVGLMPTLGDLLGVALADSAQGRSFARYLTGDRASATKPLYFDDVREHARVDGLLEDGYKLLALRNGGRELFHLAVDPGETKNIAARHTDRVEAMMARIRAQRAENERRREANRLELGDDEDEMTVQEKRELYRKLKSLGYVQ
jgi:arylsulfatase A-like enzyme